MNLNLAHLIFSLTLDGTVATPFALFDLSRRFPAAFREGTCGNASPCNNCPDSTGCPWFPLFGQALSPDPQVVKRHQKPPLPFVFSIPLLQTGSAECTDLEIGLTLLGSAINHASEFIKALELSCSRGPAGSGFSVTLDGVFSEGLFRERAAIRVSKQGTMVGDLRIIAANDLAMRTGPSQDRVSLSFLTPMRLFREGKLLRNFDGPLFLRGLIRRVSSLVATYGEEEMDVDFRWLAEHARNVQFLPFSLEYSSDHGPALAGIHGSVTVGSGCEPFLPLLGVGEYVHAGKGASWGFGRFEVRAL